MLSGVKMSCANDCVVDDVGSITKDITYLNDTQILANNI